MFIYGTLPCWILKTRLESGPVTANLTTVVQGSTLLIIDVKFVHSQRIVEIEMCNIVVSFAFKFYNLITKTHVN